VLPAAGLSDIFVEFVAASRLFPIRSRENNFKIDLKKLIASLTPPGSEGRLATPPSPENGPFQGRCSSRQEARRLLKKSGGGVEF
jgi:hypothetical protein